MKRIALLILALTVASFAQGGHCESMFQNLTKLIPDQKVKICRVTGIDEERNDISGMFFYMEIKGRRYPAVFVYGTDFVEMLYAAPPIRMRLRQSVLKASISGRSIPT